MRIRSEQISALGPVAHRQFVKRLAVFLRDRFEDAASAPGDKIEAFVASHSERAQFYGLQSQSSAANYVITAWILGGDFDVEYEAAQAELRSDERPERKANWLAVWTEQILEATEADGESEEPSRHG